MFVRRILVVSVMVFFLCAPVNAATPVKEGAKEVGQGFKTMGTQTGKAIKKGGKEVGQGLKKIGEGTGQAAKETGNEASREAKRVGQAMLQEAKKRGQSIGDWCAETYKKSVTTLVKIGNGIRDYFGGK
jgi:hypothetical protein